MGMPIIPVVTIAASGLERVEIGRRRCMCLACMFTGRIVCVCRTMDVH
jgi:hypothetical protein